MKNFKLPDLGEGLPDGTIVQWHIAEGDVVKVGQTVVEIETAKAIVEVPAPYDGEVQKLYGQAGDVINTGDHLIGFKGEPGVATEGEDSGTVVGKIEVNTTTLKEPTSASHVGKQSTSFRTQIKILPAVRLLAKELGVDLNTISPKDGAITLTQVKEAACLGEQQAYHTQTTLLSGAVASSSVSSVSRLSSVRRAMVLSMTQAHREVVPATLMDDADLHAWKLKQDISIRLIRAIECACQVEPHLNRHFDAEKMVYQDHNEINLGLAVDTKEDLYVPVIKNISAYQDADLRQKIDELKTQVQEKKLPQEDLHGATITLSNVGVLSGRYATPVVVPPMVAIVAVGRLSNQVVPDSNHNPVVHPMLPVSLTIDHRFITGGEAARFLKAFIDALEASNL